VEGISIIRYEKARGSRRRAARQDAGAEILHPQRAWVQNDNEHVVRARVEGDAVDGLRRPSLQNQEKAVPAAADRAGRMFFGRYGRALPRRRASATGAYLEEVKSMWEGWTLRRRQSSR
jgi:hypothetical protein